MKFIISTIYNNAIISTMSVFFFFFYKGFYIWEIMRYSCFVLLLSIYDHFKLSFSISKYYSKILIKITECFEQNMVHAIVYNLEYKFGNFLVMMICCDKNLKRIITILPRPELFFITIYKSYWTNLHC